MIYSLCKNYKKILIIVIPLFTICDSFLLLEEVCITYACVFQISIQKASEPRRTMSILKETNMRK